VSDLAGIVAAELRRPAPEAVRMVAEAIRAKHGDGVSAILYYGSCLRTGIDADGILDLMVLIDCYRRVYPSATLALANRMLPPNPFYLALEMAGRTVRVKYGVVSVAGFERRSRGLNAFFWARFAQPSVLVFARDAAAEQAVTRALAQSVMTFVREALPLMPPAFDSRQLWQSGLTETYRTELRPESPPLVAACIVAADPARYDRITGVALEQFGIEARASPDGARAVYQARFAPGARWRNVLRWRVRRPLGKILNLLRLVKGAFTFEGGVDYLAWKIERHSGVRVEATPWLRRHPLLGAWGVAWRLYRKGAFR
jgi:hypothetical protein